MASDGPWAGLGPFRTSPSGRDPFGEVKRDGVLVMV